MFMTIERQFTINEVAEMLKVTTRTVQRWIKAKRLRAVPIPGRGRTATEWRIPASAIEDMGFRVEDDGNA